MEKINSNKKVLQPILEEYRSPTLEQYINCPNEVEAEFYTKIYAELSNEIDNEEILKTLNSIRHHSSKIELLQLLEIKEYIIELKPQERTLLYRFFNECYAIANTLSCDLDRRKPHYPNAKKIAELINSVQDKSKQNNNIKNPYPNIFTDSGFILWNRLFENFDIKKSSQTDIKFCFEKMKKDEYIYNTVKQVDFLNWLNYLKDWDVQKPNSNANLKDPKRLSIYNLAKESLHNT